MAVDPDRLPPTLDQRLLFEQSGAHANGLPLLGFPGGIVRCLKRYAAREVLHLVRAIQPWPSHRGCCEMWERGRVSEATAETLQYRFDGPEDAPVLVLGPYLGTTWHMS